MNDKIKKVICNYLVKDLYKVEIIYYRDSIWFIDRENRYWYFEYHKVDKHLWWRWSHFTQALKIFSMDAEKEQTIFGELVNMILTKKQKLESKYPNKIFKTVGSVMNFEDEVDEKLNFQMEKTLSGGARKTMDAHKVLDQEIKTTDGHGWKPRFMVDEVLNNEVETTQHDYYILSRWVDEVLNCEVETTPTEFEITTNEVDNVLNNEVKGISSSGRSFTLKVDEALNYEVKTTKRAVMDYIDEVDEALNNEVETTSEGHWPNQYTVDEALNNEVKTMGGVDLSIRKKVDEVLNNEVETTDKVGSQFYIEADAVINFEVETTKSGELIEEDKIMDDVLEIQNIQPTERGVNDMVDFVLEVEDYQAWNGKQETKVNEVLESAIEIEKIGHLKTHRLRPVTGALDYNVDSMDSVIGGLKNEVKKVLDSTVEINSIEKLKGENPFQDIIVSHILDESDKVTDKLKMKEDDYVKTYSHDVYMCDHLVQNVLDVGVNSIHYDAEPHTQLVDGILKKA